MIEELRSRKLVAECVGGPADGDRVPALGPELYVPSDRTPEDLAPFVRDDPPACAYYRLERRGAGVVYVYQGETDA